MKNKYVCNKNDPIELNIKGRSEINDNVKL